jgi:hypothetical protein
VSAVPPVVFLVLANLLPLAGVAFWHWSLEGVVFLYWAENVVLGLANVAAMLAARADEDGKPADGWSNRIVTTVFFALHYGAFCAGHGVVLATVFALHRPDWESAADADLLSVLERLAGQPSVLLAVAAMAAGHAWDLYRGYFAGGAYRTANADRLMTAPYRRIIATHLFIFVAVFALLGLGSPLAAMAGFILLKTAVDLGVRRRAAG